MYPYDYYSHGYSYYPYDEMEDDRQPQLVRRIEQLEAENRRQVQEITRLNNEIQRLNREIRRINQEIARMNQVNVEQSQRIRNLHERLRAVENRMNIPFTGDFF